MYSPLYRHQHKMGIAAGIVVVRQITDEYKWFQAMKHIQNEFEWEDYFVILPRFNKGFPTGHFTVEAFEKLMQTEDMNFSSTGSTHINWWNPRESRLSEPTLFEFAVKEHPRLPVFGRHFKNCTSKISGASDEGEKAEIVMKKIFRILREYFPQNIAYWTELNEDGMYKLFESGLYKNDPNALISKEKFSERLKKVFFKDFTDKKDFHEARKTFAMYNLYQ